MNGATKHALRIGAACGVLSTLLWIFYNIRPQEGRWRKIAELTDSAGNQFIVAQEHYSWAEGWAINFFMLSTNQRIHAYNLKIESTPWRNIRITEEGSTINVWHRDSLVAVFYPKEKAIRDCIYNLWLTNAQGMTVVQVTNQWKFEFTYDENPHSRMD